MGDLTLFIDPNDAGYPSTVRVLLDDFEKRKNICATVTPLGKCLLICDKEIYIWSCLSKETGIPNAIHMELPATGLNYSTNLVCLFNKAQYSKHLSLLAVSPEGSLRYWAELGRQMKNDQCLLNNEVAHSIQPVDTREQHHCFLLTTTTGSFHLIDLYHGLDQPDRLTTRPLDVGGPGGGFGRRMSLLIFGSFTAEKEPILKTLFVFNKMGPNVDVVNVLSKSLRFYSIGEQKTPNYEVDLADLVLSKFNKNSQRPEHRHFLIVDAVQHLAGILLLVVGDQQQHSTTKRLLVDRKLFLAYYEESTMRREVRTLTPIQLPDSLSLTGLDNRLKTATLLCPDQDECCIAFHDSFLLIRHPTNPSASSIHVLESYTTSRAQQSSPQHREIRSDSLLGAAVVHGACHLVLKEAAVCAVRRLPRHYDLNFWKKYRPILHQLDGLGGFCIPGTQQYRLKEAFVDFCAKNLKRAQNLLQEFADQNVHSSEPAVEDEHEEEPMDIAGRKSRAVAQNKEKQSENFAEMAVDLLFYFLDRQPSTPEDPRWTFTQETAISSDQRAQLKQLAETKKFNLVLRHLQVKQAFYKMFVLFLRTCNLIEWIDYPLQNYQLQSGKAMVVELGEKLVAMVATFRWLSEHSETLPLVNRAMSELSKQYQTRYGLPKGNPFLSPTDFVFNKVSTFHELVSAVVQAGEEALAEDSRGQVKARILREIGSLFLTLVEGVREAGREGWALHIEQGQSTWLSQPDFLTHFVTHLNAALDYLEAASLPPTSSPDSESAIILEQCKQLAHFVLSQQSADQRDDSKIISRFFALGHQEFALDLAEKYKDFTFLITFCHNKLDKHSCEQTLNRYKQQYEKDGFHDFLYTWYQQKGMFNHLLAERGKRASDFISQRHELNWIRQIEEGQYTKAKKTLKRMAGKEGDEHKKLIELSLCKMAALCEDQENVAEIAELSEQIQALHEKRRQEEAADLDGQSAADEQATNPFGIQMPPAFR